MPVVSLMLVLYMFRPPLPSMFIVPPLSVMSLQTSRYPSVMFSVPVWLIVVGPEFTLAFPPFKFTVPMPEPVPPPIVRPFVPLIVSHEPGSFRLISPASVLVPTCRSWVNICEPVLMLSFLISLT